MVYELNGLRYSDKNNRGKYAECIYKTVCNAIIKRQTLDEDWVVYGEHSAECQKKYGKRKLLDTSKQDIQKRGMFSVTTKNVHVYRSTIYNNLELRGITKYSSVAKTLSRAKRKVTIEIPIKSTECFKMKHVAQQLENKEAVTYPDGDKLRTLRLVPITSTHKNEIFHHLVIYDPDFVSQFSTEPWEIDGTFDGRPNVNDCEQLLTVLAIKEVELVKKKPKQKRQNDNDQTETIRVRKPVGLFYALTSNRTQETYFAIFSYMKKTFSKLDPASAMLDYEGASRLGLVAVFPFIIIIGCWFHLCQASTANAIDKQVAEKDNKRNPKAHRQLRKMQCLALLPEDKMELGFEIVKEETRQLYCTVSFNENGQQVVEYNPFWEQYFEYHHRQWFKREKPKTTCVYHLLERTNNFCEQKHSTYKDYLHSRQPIDAMLKGLGCIVALNWLDLNDINIKNVAPPKKSSDQKERDKLIEKCWQQLDEGHYDVKQFLHEVSYFKDEKKERAIPLEAEKICITHYNYEKEQYTFEKVGEVNTDKKKKKLFSAKDIFEAPIICCNDLEEAKLIAQLEKFFFPFNGKMIFVSEFNKEEIPANYATDTWTILGEAD